jgi:hypothetical protein
MSNIKIKGVYDDEHKLLEGIRHLNSNGIKIDNVFSPFPVHGIDKLLNIKPSRLSTAAFLFGITGTSLALLMMWYMMIHDWPVNIGGKPNFSLIQNIPAFIPITFELTVLCAAHGMVLTFLLASKLYPGSKAYVAHPRVTDDKMVVEVMMDPSKAEALSAMFKETGAVEVIGQ